MNQSSPAIQSEPVTENTKQSVVKVPFQSVLVKVGAIVNVPSDTLTPLASTPASSASLSSSSTSSESSASAAVILTTSDPTSSTANEANDLSIKYRTILEELLRLRIDLVTKNISAAIKEVIVFDIAETTKDDWLLVIFKALERTLAALDVGLIHSNDTHLTAISRLLARLIETSKLLELIENRSETKNFPKYFTQKMSGVLNQVSMEAVYKNAQEIFESKRRSSFAQVRFVWWPHTICVVAE